jgi:hypothetical protein
MWMNKRKRNGVNITSDGVTAPTGRNFLKANVVAIVRGITGTMKRILKSRLKRHAREDVEIQKKHVLMSARDGVFNRGATRGSLMPISRQWAASIAESLILWYWTSIIAARSGCEYLQ